MNNLCFNNDNRIVVDKCAICERYFCDSCIWQSDQLNYCKEHIMLKKKSNWCEIHLLELDPMAPEVGLRLYRMKEKIWVEDKLPIIIETHYKLKNNSDQIITVLRVLCILKDKNTLISKLST
jgi:hypothetical protein